MHQLTSPDKTLLLMVVGEYKTQKNMNKNKDISKGPREESYVSDGLNAKKYENWRHKFDDFFDCEQYFMQNHFANTTTLLDLGGNSGGLYGALAEKFPKICYTSLDLDAEGTRKWEGKFILIQISLKETFSI